jgi:hypothetical protein
MSEAVMVLLIILFSSVFGMPSNHRYIPRDCLVTAESDVAAVADWVGECRKGDVLVITSDGPGIGVSTMLRTIEHETPSIAYVDDAPDGDGRYTVLGQKKILVIDPLDEYMTEQSKQKRVTRYLETRPIPIIVTGIRRRVSKAKVDDISRTVARRQGVTTLHIPTPPRERVIVALTQYGVENPEALWDASGGDFRHCLEAWSMSQIGDAAPDNTSFRRDFIPDGIEALTTLLSTPTQTYPEAVRMAEGDINLIVDGIFENYLDGITSIDQSSDILDILQGCDALQYHVYHDPSSEFPEMGGLLAGVEFLPCCVTKHITKHGTIWANENHRYTKAKLLRYLGIRGIDYTTAAAIRGMVCHDQHTQAPRLAAAYGEHVVWNATRLWMKSAAAASYTKTRHAALTRQKKRRREAGSTLDGTVR